jgi:hypothetical protein
MDLAVSLAALKRHPRSVNVSGSNQTHDYDPDMEENVNDSEVKVKGNTGVGRRGTRTKSALRSNSEGG